MDRLNIYIEGKYYNQYTIKKGLSKEAIKEWIKEWLRNLAPLNSSNEGILLYRKRFLGKKITAKLNYKEEVIIDFEFCG